MSAVPSYREIFKFAFPAMLAVVTEPIAGLVDTALVGHLDSQWLAALGMSVAVFSTFGWAFNFLVHGVTARVAQSLGQSDRIRVHVSLSLWLAFLGGTAAGVFLLFAENLLLSNVMGGGDELVQVAHPYYFVRAIGFPFLLLVTAITGILRGLQRVDASFWLLFCVTVGNVVLTFLFLYVWEWDLRGAAWGTTLAFAGGTVGGLIYLAIVEPGVLGLPKFNRHDLLSFGSEASHLFGRTAFLTGAFFLATMVATRLSETALAAHQVGFQCWLLASFLIDGFAVSATALGAKYIGRGEVETFYAVCRRLLLLGIVTGVGFLIFYGLGSRSVPRLFTEDEAILTALASIWAIIAFTQPLNAVVYVFDGVLFGSRDFAYLRRRMWEGVLFIFVPILALAYWYFESLVWVWVALFSLNLYRMVSSGALFFRRRLNVSVESGQ